MLLTNFHWTTGHEGRTGVPLLKRCAGFCQRPFKVSFLLHGLMRPRGHGEDS